MKKIIYLIIFIPIFLISCGHKIDNEIQYITSVHDGDTFTDSQNHQYRLFGVDTPETSSQFNGFETTTGIEKLYAIKATKHTINLIMGKNVNVTVISEDQYGRRVALISIGDIDLGLSLVAAGFARVAYISVKKYDTYYTNKFDYYKQLLKAQRYAYDHKFGFWKEINKFKLIFPKS